MGKSTEQEEEVADQLEPAFSWDFPGVAQEVIEAARTSYDGDEAPAIVVRMRESDNPKEDHSVVVSTDLPECLLVNHQQSTNEAGFVFLRAENLCGEGTYYLDLRQGGHYDDLCGPDSESFTYEGSPVWVDVDT